MYRYIIFKLSTAGEGGVRKRQICQNWGRNRVGRGKRNYHCENFIISKSWPARVQQYLVKWYNAIKFILFLNEVSFLTRKNRRLHDPSSSFCRGLGPILVEGKIWEVIGTKGRKRNSFEEYTTTLIFFYIHFYIQCFY